MRVGLAAEHGNFIRRCPLVGEPTPQWEERGRNADLSWRETIHQIFTDFVDTTPGSMLEEKEINLTWHYRNADPEFGQWQMHELVNLLQQLPKSRQFDVLLGAKTVEVRPQGTNKGFVVKEILSKESNVDFILALGDDKASALKSLSDSMM
jgi:trehalose 6-phosphate synthase/phosphatase